MNHQQLHQLIVKNRTRVQDWFRAKNQSLSFPIYSSFDLRDAGFKNVPVDANIFPAGFNNICLADRESAVETAKVFLDSHYPPGTRKILLLTEEHTQNPYYWDNVVALRTILTGAGREVQLAVPRPLNAPIEVTSASGQKVTVYSARRNGSGVDVAGFEPDLIISNNDFSTEYEEWAKDLSTPMNPPRELGWYRRRKDRFFKVYNQLAGEFCDLLGMDAWSMQVETELFSNFDPDDSSSRDELAARAGHLQERIRANYRAHGVDREPFLFVKNNAGTYGLGVIQVKDPTEIQAWNYKARKKMKAAKGGREVNEVIIQEGVPTAVQGAGGTTAEPVIYMIGCQLAGGFLRAHGDKGDEENLNSPGAVFQRLCVSDLNVKMEGCPQENAYGWIARLAFLSVAIEARELDVDFKAYRPEGGPCGSE
jgi:glutamate--cysteine ligase